MSGRPPAQERPGFVKVCLCPEIKVTAKGDIRRRDLTIQCPTCRGFAALERCAECDSRGALNAVGQRLMVGRMSVYTCEVCQGRGYRRTDRKVDPYAEKAKKK